jgi:hypothetical protein
MPKAFGAATKDDLPQAKLVFGSSLNISTGLARWH